MLQRCRKLYITPADELEEDLGVAGNEIGILMLTGAIAARIMDSVCQAASQLLRCLLRCLLSAAQELMHRPCCASSRPSALPCAQREPH